MVKSTNLKPTKTRIIILLFFIACINSFSQESEEFNHYKKLYPKASSVRLNQNTTITIKLENENINITQEFIEEDLYLNEGANQNSKKALNFSSFFELDKVEASTFNSRDGKYKEIEVNSTTGS